MDGCLKSLAAVVAALFVATAVIALLLVNGAHVLTNRTALQEALALDSLLRGALPGLIADVVAEQARAQGLPTPDLDTAVMTDAILSTLPPGWLDDTTETAVAGLLDYLETGDPSRAVLLIDITPVLAEWQGEVGRQAISDIVAALPVCTDLSSFDLSGGNLPTCLPPGVPAAELAVQLHSLVGSTLLPQIVGATAVVQIPLLADGMLNPAQLAMLQQLQQLYALAGRAWLLWLLPLLCLLLILTLAVRSPAGWGFWWGAPMAAGGLLALLLALILPALATGMMNTAVTQTAPTDGLAALWGPFLQQGFFSLTVLWGQRMLWQAGGLLLLGLIFLSYGVLATRHR